jgi:uncharacterized protein (DUF4415 family)
MTDRMVGIIPARWATKRATVVSPENEILDHFRKRIHRMGGGNYQTLIDTALREHIRRGGINVAVRRAVR